MIAEGQIVGTPVPWQSNDAIRLYVGSGSAFVGIFVAWWAAGGTVRTGTQVGWAVVAVVAIAASGTVNCRWLLAGRRSVAMRRVSVITELEMIAPSLAADAAAPPRLDRGEWVALSGSKLYHRPTCALIARKPVVAVTTPGARTPCGVCHA